MSNRQTKLIKEIAEEARLTRHYTGRDHFRADVMSAMGKVPREKFVPDDLEPYAYDNGPLPIGYGQTISQPYIVALMTDLLDTEPGDIVLEVGTGSGYQAAILSCLVERVYSIEKVPELCDQARVRLKTLGYSNIEILCGNGYTGWENHAPFDAIIVTAAASHVPPALVNQLKPGGRMVIPVGQPYMHQELIKVVKNADGTTASDSLLPVAFVPLIIDEKERVNHGSEK